MKYAEGSCLIEFGNTKVICTATIEKGVPIFLKDSGRGWLTAEYGMLPRSTKQRIIRDASKGKAGGRTQEIQRLVGRSLRAVCDLTAFPGYTIWIDADVIQADGGTRTASITGGFIALVDALNKMKKDRIVTKIPLSEYVAAVSVGISNGIPILDLTYEEDSRAQVDMNVVMTESGRFIEIQGTAEKEPFSKEELNCLLNLAKKGIRQIIKTEKRLLGNL